ncbi:MAG: bifunctional DNA-formamidopyrimidine glycosylase/DNA-(apurinic or apyrimidinic site) lyase [Coriobacteriales bacterium]|nr:bifunctional DNA-formamidopyrimidine glycosylase/DNA-(apurinic or apyrimidinic site) lyase [Coriobacteriales bacterium]
MPELPEVETIRRGLQDTIVGRTIAQIEVRSAKSFTGMSEARPGSAQTLLPADLEGQTIEAMDRRGKLLIFNLVGPLCFTAHLRMTGQMIFREVGAEGADGAFDGFAGGHPNASMIGAMPDRSTRVIFTFADGSHLYFNDQRKFGFITVLRKADLPADDFIRRLGPEPLSEDFTWQTLRDAFVRHGGESVKAALLDQSTVAGLGNIYVDESLFRTRIRPDRLAGDVSTVKLKQLTQNIKDCLTIAIEAGGSTARNYVNALGIKGDYLDAYAHVYGRAGQPCHACGTLLKKTKVAGRGTVYCPHCQRR